MAHTVQEKTMSDTEGSIQEEIHRRPEDLAYPVVDNYRIFAGSGCYVTNGPHLVEQHSGSTGWQCVWCSVIFNMLPWTLLQSSGAGHGYCDQCGEQYYHLNSVETPYKSTQALCHECTNLFVSGDYPPQNITLPSLSRDPITYINENVLIENVLRRLMELELKVSALKEQIDRA